MNDEPTWRGTDAHTGEQFHIYLDEYGQQWVSYRADAWSTWSPKVLLEAVKVA